MLERVIQRSIYQVGNRHDRPDARFKSSLANYEKVYGALATGVAVAITLLLSLGMLYVVSCVRREVIVAEYKLTSTDIGLLAEIKGFMAAKAFEGSRQAAEYEAALERLLHKIVSYKSV